MRLFLALWPGDEVRGALSEVAVALAELAAGRPVPAEKIHLTLAFLGEVPATRVGDVLLAAGAARGKGFEFALDGVGSFRKARVAWAGTSRAPAALAQLQSSLEGELRARAFELDERPFTAHVTLARKIARPVAAAPMPPIRWRAAEFVLARSETGTGRYSVMQAWPLDRD